MRDPARERFEALFGPEFGHGKPFDLNPLRASLSALGNPHEKLPPVIHVAGTNGKGSTIAFTRAIAEAAGLEVHAFTKPHLFTLNERFVIAGAPTQTDALIAAAERIAAVAPDFTQFDAQVAAAFLLFSETPADLILLETGMGGRDDSTNVIAKPALSVITPIGLDHQDAHGATLSEIAAHKAGIIKAGVPAVIGRQTDDARDVLEATAERFGAPLHRQGVEWDAYANSGRLVVQTETRALDLPLPALYGAHQIDNAGLACAALLAQSHYKISDDAFAEGVANAVWPARLQPLTRGGFSAPVRAIGGEVWIDGGHNAHGAQALAQALSAMRRRREAPTVAIIGMLARKDAEGFVRAFAGAVDHIIAVPLPEPHVAPALIASQAEAYGIVATTTPSLAAAMQNAAQFPAPRVLICGSFVLAAEALAAESD
ncbi:bifunctional folylpolyglutamate synthase/dihydrofolate synthase [Terricaulis silvestris]|uniref:Dihydrofolate synthase/folylpolyglutamate synthase n=1 Tax=Terricaulis silvestris TaxID=2686094 RepID=A0A6I6MMW0_9CAUL|nr:Mur ligase family protein [Terricaulis silvestris]QGZ96650.1 Folylpolyglutamate synthase [Terricaulis silvestris]